jgi:OOP family OmpA-OmpF porin
MNAKILACTAALLTALAVPARAEIINYDGFYLSGLAGYNYLNANESTPYSNGTIVGVTSQIDFTGGFGVGGSAGYSHGNGLRTELEYAYRSNDVNDVRPQAGADSPLDGGSITLQTIMANAIYDLPFEWYVRPFAGVGIGVGMADYKDITNLGGFTIDDSATGLAYQALAGFAVPLSDRFSADLQYRWVATDQFELETNFANTQSDLNYASHNVMVGLRYMLGEPVSMPMRQPAAAPAPAPMMAPAAPMPAPVAAPAPRAAPVPVVPQTYIVFFDFDKTIITPEAERVLQRAAADMRVGQGVKIHVIGHADRAGSARYNQRLSERRGKVVHDRLVELGVNDDQIMARGMGENQNRVPTGDGVREAQNRRAEIIFQ